MPRPASISRALVAATLGVVATLAACGKKEPPPPPDPKAQASASVSATIAAVKAARVAQGEQLFQKYCALCHGPEAKGYVADHAPSLVTKTFLETVGDGFLARAMREGRPGTPMAAYAKSRGGPLSEDDVLAITMWLRAKGPAPIALPPSTLRGDATAGEATYNDTCAKCHGTKDQRGEAPQLSNPTFITTASDEFLRYAVRNGRPGTPMVAFGEPLGDQRIADVVAFLRASMPPPPEPARREAPIEVPVLPPYVVNPKGKTPNFKLKEDRYASVDDVKRALDAKSRMVIIDARPSSAWLTGHIPGALPIPYYQVQSLDVVPKDGTWVIAYCACPHHASGAVVDELRRRGYTHTAVLDEGIGVWETRKYPMVAGSASAAPAASAPPR